MFCIHTHSAYIFYPEMWPLICWAEAVTKRGGRVLLNVQLFDSLEPGYKRMLSQQLQQMQPRMAASLHVIVAKPMQKQHIISPPRMIFFKRADLAGQSAS